MVGVLTKIHLQPFVVVGRSDTTPMQGTNVSDAPEGAAISPYGGLVNYSTGLVNYSAGTGPVTITAMPQTQLLNVTFSSVPVVARAELQGEYVELADALTEMVEMTDDDEWAIELPVYQVACQVAAELAVKAFPAPRVLTHGPKSVVFNWTQGKNNLYLTISADRMSALLSSPERIKRRIDFSARERLEPGKLFGQLMSLPPTQLASSSSTADLTISRFPE